MKKKFICAVCGYIYEGDAAPEKCPVCKAPASKFSELQDTGDVTYATVHKIGDGKPEGVSEEMINDLRAHFNGECSEVGQYLAMARQADREGYPEVRWCSTQRPIWRSVLLLNMVHVPTSSSWPSRPRLWVLMPSTTWFMRLQRTRLVMEQASQDC